MDSNFYKSKRNEAVRSMYRLSAINSAFFLLEEAMKDPSNKEMLVFNGSHCNACKQLELQRPYNIIDKKIEKK